MGEEIVRLHYTEAELRRDGAKALHQFGVQATYKIDLPALLCEGECAIVLF